MLSEVQRRSMSEHAETAAVTVTGCPYVFNGLVHRAVTALRGRRSMGANEHHLRKLWMSRVNFNSKIQQKTVSPFSVWRHQLRTSRLQLETKLFCKYVNGVVPLGITGGLFFSRRS